MKLIRLVMCVPLLAFGVRGQKTSSEDAFTQQLPIVEAAALHAQTLEEAPANVTVITAAEIRKYGYRTLAEALASVRGFYVTNDRIYRYVGVRGFGLPGDYNTRFLVMLNGHPLTEKVYSSNGFFGQDFGVDMDLVERIEIIRGPTAALYGSNGIFANINIVTRSPVDSARWRLSTETGSFGEKKVQASASLYLGRGVNLLVSGSGFNNRGQDLYFPEYDSPEMNNGWVRDADGERGFHTFANLIWHNWSFLGYFNSRQKKAPMAWDQPAIFGDRGAHVQDERNFAGAVYTGDLGEKGKLRWQTFFDQYRYDQRFDYADGDTVWDERQIGRGDWIDSQLSYTFDAGRAGTLTVGVKGTWEFQNLQYNLAVAPTPVDRLRISKPDRQAAIFVQQEMKLASKWKAYFGIRFDASRNFNNNISPRIALVYERDPKTVWKFVYGRPFRNPSVYEQYFEDGLSMIQPPHLRPETAQTFEVSVERRFGKEWSGTLTAFHYNLNDLIEFNFPNGEPLGFYGNANHDQASGVEAELKGRLKYGIEADASMALQWASEGSPPHSLPDSPRSVGKLRAGIPLLGGKLFASASASYLSARETINPPALAPVRLADFTITTIHLHSNFDLEAGMRNAFNYKYFDPVGLAIDRMRADGRSVFLKLIWHARE